MTQKISLTPQQKALQKKLRISWYNGSIFRGRNLSPAYRYIYWYFLKHCCPRNPSADAPFVWGATHEQIGEWCGCSDQTVYRAVKELIACGLISYITKGRKGRYSIFGLTTHPEFLDKQIDPLDKQNEFSDKQIDPLDKQIGGPSVCTSSVCTNVCTPSVEQGGENIIGEEKTKKEGANKLNKPVWQWDIENDPMDKALAELFVNEVPPNVERLAGTRGGK